jgi:hypothetical protein
MQSVKVGSMDFVRVSPGTTRHYELSYASINWIRFEGSPCRARCASMASQPPAGAPLVYLEKSAFWRFSRNIGFVAGGKKRGFCRLA